MKLPHFEVLQFSWNSSIYPVALGLRHAVLRAPLGRDFTSEELARDKQAFHFALMEDGRLLAVMSLHPESARTLRMRQVAVSQMHQGKGLGSQLLHHAEDWARVTGYEHIQLHARAGAVPFYLKNGYLMQGEPFEELGIPHYRMTKSLS